MSSTRRVFLKNSAVVTASLVTAGSLAATEQKKQLPIIDTHQHLWDLTKFQPPWLGGAPKVLASSYTTKEYLAATKGLNVVKAVYMEVDVHPRQQVEEAEHVIALSKSKDHPTVAAVISGRPNSASFEPYILKFKDSQYIKGVRQVLHVDTAKKGMCLQPQFVKSTKLLGEIGKSLDLCMRPTELLDGLKLAKMCPDTRFILDHCGNADPKAFMKNAKEEPWHEREQWKKDIAALAKQSNIICKISGIVARAPEKWTSDQLAPIVNHCLDEFGPDRVVFGGDWPVCRLRATFTQWVDGLKEVISNRPVAQQKKLLHDNAARLYKV